MSFALIEYFFFCCSFYNFLICPNFNKPTVWVLNGSHDQHFQRKLCFFFQFAKFYVFSFFLRYLPSSVFLPCNKTLFIPIGIMKDARWMKLDNRTNVIVTLCANTGFSQALAAGEMQFHNIGPRSFRCWLAAVSQLWAIVGNIIPPWFVRRRFQCRLAAVLRLF